MGADVIKLNRVKMSQKRGGSSVAENPRCKAQKPEEKKEARGCFF